MSLRPKKGSVLVELDVENVSEGGIILPESRKETELADGTVSALGKDVEEYKIGDRVLVHRYSGTGLVVDGKETLLLEEGEVLGCYE